MAHKTGLTPNTLRAWERRYPGIAPDRDDRGHRVYSEELLEKLILISVLVDQGYRIGQLANRPNGDLRALKESLNHSQPTDFMPDPSLERAVTAIHRFDDTALWSELERATTVYGRLDVIDSFIFPLTHEIDARITEQTFHKVHLSFMQAALRTFLSTLLAPMAGDPLRPIVVFAYPPGQIIDLGGIASAVHIHAAGWHPVLLGGSVPAEQTIAAATMLNARAVIVAAVTDTYDTTILNEMVRVRRGIPDAVPVFVGGRMPGRLVEDIVAGGLVAMRNMLELRERLRALISDTPS
ncbi:MAG: MerR family transcriptional regulator [Spirochaetaceae bacterium]